MLREFKENTVLIVDDIPENLKVLMLTLKNEYAILAATNGKQALKIAHGEKKPDIILLDIMMPGMDGYEVCRRLKDDPYTVDIPIVFLTALDEDQNEVAGLNLGAVDYITKPINPKLVRVRVKNHIELKRHRDHLEELVRERTFALEEKTKELSITQEVTIHSLGTLAEYRDPETGGHIKRTQNYIKILAEYLMEKPEFSQELDPKTVNLLYKSAPLHDIGKVGVADNILLNKGPLSKDEFEEMKRHTIYGHNAILKSESMLGHESFLRIAREIAYSHHEKWDGSGYPLGLKGEEIPLPGRLMAIADVYDALISKRVYKPPFTHQKAVKIITEGDGRTTPEHFDPRVLNAFKELEGRFKEVALSFIDFNEEREALLKNGE